MQIFQIDDKNRYNSNICNQKQSQFLQSWEWGEFQNEVGRKILRYGIEEDGKLISTFTFIKKSLPMGKSYFYCPRLDIRYWTLDIENLTNKIKDLAKNENAIFLRFEPRSNPSLVLPFVRGGKLKVEKTIDVQPSKTLILNLDKSEDELLTNMHQKTRYNIRLAEKKGVKIVETQDFASRFDEFWSLMDQTKERDGFRLHNKEYYKKMLEINFIKLYLAEYKGKIIAGNIISFFGDTVTYIHGASSNKYRNVMAPYLLQWQVIKKAKTQGFKYYDFYGIDEKKWPGVTRFKRGFSGDKINYPGTFDLVFNKFWYNIYKIARAVRRLK